jgi:hypothetical protein
MSIRNVMDTELFDEIMIGVVIGLFVGVFLLRVFG